MGSWMWLFFLFLFLFFLMKIGCDYVGIHYFIVLYIKIENLMLGELLSRFLK